MQVVMLLYPRLTQLDLTGPFEVCARSQELNVHRRAAAALQIAEIGIHGPACNESPLGHYLG